MTDAEKLILSRGFWSTGDEDFLCIHTNDAIEILKLVERERDALRNELETLTLDTARD
jgi:hypothetical protein